jgi:hypothetical protein
MRINLFGVVATLAFAAMTSFAAPTAAATYHFEYSATDGGAPMFASGLLTTSDVVNAVGGYDILSVSGQVDGDVIVGLTPNPSQPFDSVLPDENYDFDNVLFPSPPTLDFFGVLFHSATTDYNIFTDASPTDFVMLSSPTGIALGIDDFHDTPYPGYSHGDFSVTSVPEPASWALLVGGFAFVGTMLQRRRISHRVA